MSMHFQKLKGILQNNWKSLLLLIVIWLIISQYGSLYKHILEASQLAKCVSDDNNTIKPCKFLLELSGKLLFLFGLASVSLLIFKEQKETIIKMIFVYYSAVTVLYTTGIGYTDIEQQKVQLKLNQEYNTAKQENDMLIVYKNHHSNDFEHKLKIKELELSIENRNIYYQVLQEEAKLYLQYKATASFSIIILSYILLLILLLQLGIDKIRIIFILLILFLLSNPI